MNLLPTILLLTLVSTLHADAQEEHRTTKDYNLRGPVRAVWERTTEYHGVLDFLSENRGRVLSERRLSFDSLGRLLREERRDGKGRVVSITTYAWNGSVVVCRERQEGGWRPHTNYSVRVEDSAGYLVHGTYYPDSGSIGHSVSRYDRNGHEEHFYLRDSVSFDSTRRVWMPGLASIEGFAMNVTDRSSDSSGWSYSWACSFFDTTAMLWFGNRHDKRGRLVESFEHPVFGCWASSSRRAEYVYNEHDDLIVTDQTVWLEKGGCEYDYRYDERDNWTQMITSGIEYIWILPVSLPMEKTVRVIEYGSAGQ